jgi:peptidoglycan DL-endopeptidase LytF
MDTVPPPFNNQVTAPPPAVGGASEYKVAKGDTYSSIAKKFNVSIKAIADANPGVDPARLQINQKLNIPAPSAPAAVSTAPAPTSAEGQVYTVVSGDNLTKIATKFGVTVKALRSANNLTTDQIKGRSEVEDPGQRSIAAGDNTNIARGKQMN